MAKSLLLLLSLVLRYTSGADDQSTAIPDYLIIGAGGSGIQAALLLQKYNHTCTILEKEDVVGSFWNRFPAFGELISVNKKVRNETQQWKFDWHSMLEAPNGLRMLDITRDYFPQGKDWQEYMTRVVEEANLKVEYGVEVASAARDGTPCVLLANGTKRCARYRVFMGTGMKEKSEPLLEAMGGTPYSRMTREAARDKHVCILGNGNAGYETAQNVYDVAERVILYGKHPVRLSSITRYTGDVRVKFLQPVENFHAKLLDTVDHFAAGTRHQGLDKHFNEREVTQITDAVQSAAFLKRFECEVFVIATGFQSNVPGLQFQDRFPPSEDWYASAENPLIHYIGWLMHERDFQKGAGGFLSGYRYLLRNLVHHINQEDHGIPYPRRILSSKEEVIDHVVKRIQVVDDLIILQDGVLLNDCILPLKDGTGRYEYYEGITLPFHHDLKNRPDLVRVYFAWGNGRRASNVFESVLRYSDSGALINLFLHPVVEVQGLARDTHEDIEMIWNDPSSQKTNGKVVRDALEGNLTLFRPKQYFPYIPAQVKHTEERNHFEPSNRQPKHSNELLQYFMDTVGHDYHPVMLDIIRDFSKGYFKSLFPEEPSQETAAAGNRCAMESTAHVEMEGGFCAE